VFKGSLAKWVKVVAAQDFVSTTGVFSRYGVCGILYCPGEVGVGAFGLKSEGYFYSPRVVIL